MNGSPFVLSRSDRARSSAEAWRPPLIGTGTNPLVRSLVSRARRLADLQYDTIWRDLEQLLPGAEGTVLDVGCGAQPYRALLPEGVRYVGIDTSDAPARFGYEAPDTRYFQGDRFPVESGSCDLVLCTETLEHVRDTRAFLAEIVRCTRPGGRVLLTVPFSARYHFIPHDFWRFTPSSLSWLLADAGLADVRVYARGNPVTVACQKWMTLVLQALGGGGSLPHALALRSLGALGLPLFGVLALTANLSLGADFGDDCLGYTVVAQRPSSQS